MASSIFGFFRQLQPGLASRQQSFPSVVSTSTHVLALTYFAIDPAAIAFVADDVQISGGPNNSTDKAKLSAFLSSETKKEE